MKRIDVKQEHKHYMPELLNSIQDVASENLKRALSGIANGRGCILNGFKIFQNGGQYSIEPGVAVSPSGEILILETSINVNGSFPVDQSAYISYKKTLDPTLIVDMIDGTSSEYIETGTDVTVRYGVAAEPGEVCIGTPGEQMSGLLDDRNIKAANIYAESVSAGNLSVTGIGAFAKVTSTSASISSLEVAKVKVSSAEYTLKTESFSIIANGVSQVLTFKGGMLVQ